MKRILRVSVSKIYLVYLFLLTIFVIGTYSSYAYFTVQKEKKNAISMIVGNLTGELLIDGEKEINLVVEGYGSKVFTIQLTNKNEQDARYNLYYKGSYPDVEIGYLESDGIMTPPSEKGITLKKQGTLGSIGIYKIRVKNKTGNKVTIPIGYQVGLDYNDLSIDSNSHIFEKAEVKANTPELGNNMIPVRYDGSNWVKVDTNNWYNYDEQEWANAVTIDNSKVLDLSGKGNHKTMEGVIVSNGVAEFEGKGDTIDLGYADYDFGTAFSAIFKIKVNQMPTTSGGATWPNTFKETIFKGDITPGGSIKRRNRNTNGINQ